MDYKIFHFLFLLFIIFFFEGCGKKSNGKLAQTYYKFALLELSEKENDEQGYKQALDYMEKAIEHECKAEYLALKATLLFKLGKNEEGGKNFDFALSQKLDSKVRAEILNNKACLLAEIGIKNSKESEIKQAISLWEELENDKSYLTPEVCLFNQSKVYLIKKDYGMAKEKLIRAINLSPSYIDAHYYLGLVSYHLKDLELAKNELGTVLFLEPGHEGAKYLSALLNK